MRTLTFESREEWLAGRRGKITGSRLKNIVTKRGNDHKIGFYELIAERLGIPPDEEDAMDRGTRLEPEALEMFTKETDKKLDTSLVMWTRDDNESVAISPDAFVVPGKKKPIEEAVEAKCLSSARHIEAVITGKVPKEYEDQVIQYFVVNDALKTLYVVFYDPRLAYKPYFVIEVKRDEMVEQIEEYLEMEKSILTEVNRVVNELTF